MPTKYAELHCHSNYSFYEGASFPEELIATAKMLEYPALALTDHNNLCGAMEFARLANRNGIQPITGVELTLSEESHVTLLAETREGYTNLCNLITASHMDMDGTRRQPRLNPRALEGGAKGLILLTGCSKGRVPSLINESNFTGAAEELQKYIEWFGHQNVFVELQQNLVYGDTPRNRGLVSLAQDHGLEVVATNNVHYHVPERHRLQDVLVTIHHNQNLEETHSQRRPNTNFYLRSANEMSTYFRSLPNAINNTILIAERCSFNLETNLGYKFPSYDNLPPGHTPYSYLVQICNEAAIRKYGSIRSSIQNRLDEELRLIKKHDLAGFLLIYYEVMQIAQEVMIDLGYSNWETPLEERSPGRGRGSSVAMLVGYLIGLSHIDPLHYDLKLDRFINNDTESVPDIDIDFPRDIREETIKRIHQKYGRERAALTGAIATYGIKGCIRDIGKALGIAKEEIDKLAKRVDGHHANSLESEIQQLPEFQDKINTTSWQMLIDLVVQLHGFPKYLMQHPSGMIISDTSLANMVPILPGGTEGRYICQWDKETIGDAGFLKIDLLGLATLSQMQDTLDLIYKRTSKYEDLSKINFEDKNVYESIHRADTVGVFQIESPAQIQTVGRLRPRNLQDMAYQIASVRPGVGHNDGVSQFIDRHTFGVDWDYDHPLEKPALERTKGVILYQDQVNELAVCVAGFNYEDADLLRRAFSRKRNKRLLENYWEKFRMGAAENDIDEETASKIFQKFSGQYMFPESHAYAFGITAYQMAWLKYYYPLEFFVAIFNQQPMGFYSLETLKEDAKRHGIRILAPDINYSEGVSVIRDSKAFWLGFFNVKGIGRTHVDLILNERKNGVFTSLSETVRRTGLHQTAIENLVTAGAFDSLVSNRRTARWEAGLLYRPTGDQQPLPLPVTQDMTTLPDLTTWDKMVSEHEVMNIYPTSHIMAHIRSRLPTKTISSKDVPDLSDGTSVTVAGLVIRRQHPRASAIFITLEDEFGHTPLILWPDVFQRYRLVIREPLLKVHGIVSKRRGTLNILVRHVEAIPFPTALPAAKNWS